MRPGEGAGRAFCEPVLKEKAMKRVSLTSLSACLVCVSGGLALADCGIPAGSVRILSNDFEALRIVADGAKECASAGVTVTANQTVQHKNLQVPALKINPAEYTVAMIANNSIVPLLNDDLIRPLDDLVAKYGQELQPGQLIKINGKVMAIAFMGNAQHMMYRKDILEKAGVKPPASYEDVLAAAKAIKDKGLMQYPLAASDKAGWDLATEFVNMYLGEGGDFFSPGAATLAIDNPKGVAALDMMKALTAYMAPDFLTYGANELKANYLGGKTAMMNEWGSLAGSIIDAKSAAPEISAATVLASAPMVSGGTVPSGALWWDGFAISKNISDADAEASFRAVVHGIRPEIATKFPGAATWLIKGYVPGPSAIGVMATIKGGAKPYPMQPYMGLLQTALGTELPAFLQGSKDAKQTLAAIGATYATAAKEAGYLK